LKNFHESIQRIRRKTRAETTDWDYVHWEFDDIIDGSIIDSNKEGRDRYPQVRKTIRIKHDGGTLHASEYIQDRKGEAPYVIRFEYDWQYDPGNPEASWKFHYDTYHPEQYWPATKHFHQHAQPNPQKTSHGRMSNFSARDVCAVLETIRVALRVSGKLPLP
jgi:hypothetical protein